ncbi:larval cuticle protein 65Ag1-like isoform X1 [Lucilia sericata]|nr:larval cuticle protein 65Ag1-like isoform X1 [Lucilia sericata]
MSFYRIALVWPFTTIGRDHISSTKIVFKPSYSFKLLSLIKRRSLRTNKQIKMKFIIVFAALFAVALAAPRPEDAVVLRSESEVGPESYQYAYETSDGNKAEEQGQLKNVGTEEEAIVVKGSYSFVADDGQTYTVNYVADENGFQPQGAHLPVAPEA